MKSAIKFLIGICILSLTMVSCDDTESYADLLKDENVAVNNFLADQRIESEIPEDSIFEYGLNAPYYKLDDDGNVYLYYVRLLHTGNEIFGAKMSKDLKRIEEDSDLLLIKAEEPWEAMDCFVAEGPYVLKHKGKYYMTYSCNHTRSPDYAMGYAVADCPTGPFVKHKDNPILHRNGKIVGVGHSSMCVNPDEGIMLCAYHCHNIDNENFKPRQTCIAPAWFAEKEGCDDELCVENP